MNTAATHTPRLHDLARERFLFHEKKPLFLGDWLRTTFIHYSIDPQILQPYVPFKLDVVDGVAYVSLVAFKMNRLRPSVGGRLTEFLFTPIATHEFFNARTYVRHEGESGIYFIAEWLSNWLSTQLGPITYGLPYRFGNIHYQHQHEIGSIEGLVEGTKKRFAYRSTLEGKGFGPCRKDSLSEFLLERYTAYTGESGKRRCFRIWHEPWQQQETAIQVIDDDLLQLAGSWHSHLKLVGANYSPGVEGVWMGRPHLLT